MTDFDGHDDSNFWVRRSGRLGVNSDCSVHAPAFEIGKKYVLLLGIQPDVKQFEQVSGDQDRWVRYIENLVAARSRE
jgi:hypothetical protein